MKAEKSPTFSASSLWRSRWFRYHLLAFAAFNGLLYGWILAAHNLIPFQTASYHLNSFHSIPDSRVTQPASFHLLEAMGQYDAQLYLQIAAQGYPGPPEVGVFPSVYAFPPLYPMLLGLFGALAGNVLLGGFILAQLLLLAGFAAIYWLVSRWYSETLAAKTAWLVFAYPFSVFYRSYFTEGLFLLLLAVFLDNLRTRQWLRTAAVAGLLTITRFVGGAAILVLGARLLVESCRRRIDRQKLLSYLAISAAPLLLFMAWCWTQTGNPFYFFVAQSNWIKPHVFFPGSATLWSFSHIAELRWHFFHSSRVDLISITVFGLLLIFSRRWLPKYWWWLALLLWAIPPLTGDTMSASRYQIVNLPLFIYVAHKLDGWRYGAVLVACLMGLAMVAILFSDWVWIG